MINNIGSSARNNYLRMIFTLQLSTSFQNPYRMKWRTKIRIIDTFPIGNGVNSCTPWRIKRIKSELWIKSKDLRHLSQKQPTLTAM